MSRARSRPWGLRRVDAVDGLLRGVRLGLCAADRQRTAPRRVLLHVGGGGRERRAVLSGEVWTPRRRVRGGLTRAFLATERVRVAEAPAGGIGETPAPPAPGDKKNPLAGGGG